MLRLAGALDLATVDSVEDMVVAMCCQGDLVLDLSGLTFCDCRGLSLFIRLSQRCRAQNASLRLAAPQGVVLMVMARLNFDKAVPVYRDLAAALRGNPAGRIAEAASDLRR